MDVRYSKQARKFLEKQDVPTQQRIRSAISEIPDGDVKKLQGQPGYRLRIGDFRVLFNREGFVILVVKIGNRGQICK